LAQAVGTRREAPGPHWHEPLLQLIRSPAPAADRERMAPQDEALKVGDAVEVVGMPEASGMNGITGTLLKTVGKGRWAIKVEGDDRSKVVSTDNLQLRAMQPKKAHAMVAPKNYSIVGTWDDWEPTEMSWNAEAECFEHRVIMGDSGSESFKVLLDGDWDKCVHPDRKDASPHMAHDVLGPDDGGLDEEWTIGLDEKDDSAEGAVYKVRMYVNPHGQPMRVGWEVLRKEASRPPVQQFVEAFKEFKEEPVPALTARPQGGLAREAADKAGDVRSMGASRRWDTKPSPFYADEDEKPPAGGGGQQVAAVETADTRRAAEVILRQERDARERLARRLADAAEIDMPAITDGRATEDAEEKKEKLALMRYSADLQELGHQHQVEVNLERYRMTVKQYMAPPHLELVVRRPPADPDACVESAEETEALRKEGWCHSVMCDGLTAARRVEELVADGSLSRPMARQYIMKRYPGSFQQ